MTETIVRRGALFFAMLLSGGNLALPRAPILMAMILCILMVSNPAKVLRSEFGRIWTLLLVILIVALLGGKALAPIDFAVRYANFLGAILLIAVYIDLPRSTLMRDALPLFIVFTIQAIATPIVASVFPSSISTFAVNETVQYTFGYILFYHETIQGAGFMGLARPNGFFFEPGVLQIYLNLFLCSALFYQRSVRLTVFALAGVAATQSTTGLAISCALIGWSIIQYMRRLDASTALLTATALPIVVLPIFWFTYQNIIEKFFGALSTSTSAREFDLLTGLRIIGEHPVFGIGFSQERFRAEFFTFGRQVDTILGSDALERSLSNGLIHLAVILGIPIMLVFVIALFRQRFFAPAAVGGGVIALSMLTEALILTPFFCMIAFSGLLVTQKYAAPTAPAYRRVGHVTQVGR